MINEFIARVRNLSKPADYFQKVYNEAYEIGLKEGKDIGERIAHNRTLAHELPHILSRYAQLQVTIINKPKSFIQQELEKFELEEVARLKMELQER